MNGLKTNFRVRSRLDAFYTGGPVRASRDGATLACACADEVKVGRIYDYFNDFYDNNKCMQCHAEVFSSLLFSFAYVLRAVG